MNRVLSLKEQYQLMDEATYLRVTTLIPKLMREEKIDFWIILAREYNEDPILNYITLTDYPNARRLACLMFYDDGKEIVRMNGGRPDPSFKGLYEDTWKLDVEEQLEGIKRVITACNPKVIGMNYSSNFAFGDGLSKGLYDEFISEMGLAISEKIVSAERLCVRYLETRTELEQEYYREIAPLAESIIRKCYSREIIHPNITTCADLQWFLLQETNDLGLTCWFPATIDIQRPHVGYLEGDAVIQEGDLIHCDYGLNYLGLCTDTQRLGYVSRENETDIPEDLKEAMQENSLFQDIVTNNMVCGKTGNEILLKSLADAKNAGIKAILYSHPLGTHGHGAGPTIGLYNQQSSISVRGDYKLYPNTNYALELTTLHFVPSFGIDVRMMTEESIKFDGNKVEYMMTKRKEIILI